MSDLEEVAQLLHNKTMEGKLKWQLAGDYRITVRQGESFIELDKARAMPPSYRLTLRNKDGIQLASDEYNLGMKLFRAMQELMEKAKRDALGVDQAVGNLKELLSQL